jgi:hypothetical protein
MRADLAALALATGLLSAPSASAFCRTTTAPPPADFQPGEDGCFTSGAPLFHSSQCVPYRLTTRASNQITKAVLSETLASAFATWTAPNAHCTPGISGIELAPTDRETIASYARGQRGDNIVGFVTPWPHGPSETLALTTLTFDATSGEIFDADLEINDDVAWSTTDPVPPEGFDLQSALTHEVGHLLGLAHSVEPDAAMFASYEPGSSSQRALDDDDARGICAAYPSRAVRATAAGLVPATACELTPGAPGGGCGDPEIMHGCAAAPRPAPASSNGLAFWGGLLLAVTLGAAARRSRQPQPSRGA